MLLQHFKWFVWKGGIHMKWPFNGNIDDKPWDGQGYPIFKTGPNNHDCLSQSSCVDRNSCPVTQPLSLPVRKRKKLRKKLCLFSQDLPVFCNWVTRTPMYPSKIIVPKSWKVFADLDWYRIRMIKEFGCQNRDIQFNWDKHDIP